MQVVTRAIESRDKPLLFLIVTCAEVGASNSSFMHGSITWQFEHNDTAKHSDTPTHCDLSSSDTRWLSICLKYILEGQVVEDDGKAANAPLCVSEPQAFSAAAPIGSTRSKRQVSLLENPSEQQHKLQSKCAFKKALVGSHPIHRLTREKKPRHTHAHTSRRLRAPLDSATASTTASSPARVSISFSLARRPSPARQESPPEDTSQKQVCVRVLVSFRKHSCEWYSRSLAAREQPLQNWQRPTCLALVLVSLTLVFYACSNDQLLMCSLERRSTSLASPSPPLSPHSDYYFLSDQAKMASELHVQKRLHRVFENAKNSLNIETQVCHAGVHAPATMYHMDISFRSTRNKWSIAKRYSEFYKVRRTLQKFLKQFKPQSDCPLPLKTLEEAIEAAFPRRHLRPDTPAIIEQRKPALEAFVQLLVKVIASVPQADTSSPVASPVVSPAGKGPASSTSTPVLASESMAFLYQVLRDFLEYPDKQIESETKLKLAVLSLEDVIVSSKSHLFFDSDATSSRSRGPGVTTTAQCLGECCSICLGDWDDEECADMNVVKLPCLHAFHEECLMEWLHGNAHCPMCREEPGSSPSASPSKDAAPSTPAPLAGH